MPTAGTPIMPRGMRWSGSPPIDPDLHSLLKFHYGAHIPIESPLCSAQSRILSMLSESEMENEAQLWEQYFEADCHLVGAIKRCYGHIKDFKVLVYELVSARQRAIARVCRALANIPVGYSLPPAGQHKDQLLKAIDMAQRIEHLSIRYTKRVLRYNFKFPDGPAPTVAHIRCKKYLEPTPEAGNVDDSGEHGGSISSEDEDDLTLEGSDSDSEGESGSKATGLRAVRSDSGARKSLGKTSAGITGQNPRRSQSTSLQQPASSSNRVMKELLPGKTNLGATHSGSSRPPFVLRALLKHTSGSKLLPKESDVQPASPIKGKSFPRKRPAAELSETDPETPDEVSFPIPCPYGKCEVVITSMDHAMSHWILHPNGQFRCPTCKNRVIKFAHSVKRHCTSVHKLNPESPEVLEQIGLGCQRLTKMWRESVGLSTTGDYEVYTWGQSEV